MSVGKGDSSRLSNATAALRAGDLERAERLALAIVERQPAAKVVLVNTLMMQRRFDEALVWLNELIARQPEPSLIQARAHALNAIGVERLTAGDIESAANSFNSALESQPSHRDASYNLAICHLRGGRPADAHALLEPMLSADPGPETLYYAAASQAALSNHSQALDLLERARIAGSGDADLLVRIGEELLGLFRFAQAADCFEQAAGISDPEGDRMLRCSSARARAGQADQAEKGLRRLIRDHRNASQAREVLIQMLIDEGRPEEAGDLVGSPDQWRQQPLRVLMSALATALPMPESATAIDADRQRVSKALDALWDIGPVGIDSPADLHWNNFYLTYHGRDNRDLNSRSGNLLVREIAESRPHLHSAVQVRGRQVGFLSSRWGKTVVGSYFSPWIEAARSAGYETVLMTIPSGRNQPGEETTRLADRSLMLDANPDNRVEAIRELGLSALVIPELGADVVGLSLAACRLAPLQLMGWGHPDTSGLATMDGFITAGVMEPDAADQHYRERLLQLPGIGTCYPNPAISSRRRRSDFSLPESARLYVFPHSPFKVHFITLSMICRLLSRDAKARLVVFEFHEIGIWRRFLNRLHAQLADHGVDADDRLIILPFMSRPDFLNVLDLCDVMVDNHHYSGGNTSLDALAMGLPVVTWPGQFMRGRQTAGMLQLIDHCELIAGSELEFVDRCIEVASQWGKGQRQQLKTDAAEGLFDDSRPLAEFGSLLKQLLGH